MDSTEKVIKWADIVRKHTNFEWPKDSLESLISTLEGKLSCEDLGYNDWIVRRIDDSFLIKVHNELSEERKNFLIACGIATVFIFGYGFGKDKWNEVPNNEDLHTFAYTEQIQVFASQLLIPRDRLFYEIDEYVDGPSGRVDIKGLAKDYKLSENMVEWWVIYNHLASRSLF